MTSLKDYERIERAIRFIEQHAPEQPELETIARAVDMSPTHFQRIFRRWAGISPKRFLQFLTRNAALEQLAAGRSVFQAALDVGLSGGGRLHDLLVTVDALSPGEVREQGRGVTICYGFYDTPFGPCMVASTARGICALEFLGDDADEVVNRLKERWRHASLRPDDDAHRLVVQQMFQADAGGKVTVSVVGSNFQLKVWEALLRIEPGTLVSYADIAQSIGRPGAERAVGNAVGSNPVAYLIPCHRVIRASGAFGEYRWGSARKRAMAAWEHGRRECSPATAIIR